MDLYSSKSVYQCIIIFLIDSMIPTPYTLQCSSTGVIRAHVMSDSHINLWPRYPRRYDRRSLLYCNGAHGAKEVEGRLILPKGKGYR